MYCNNCGKKVSGKKCSNCKDDAKIKNTLFGDYIFDYGKDKAKDTLFNKIVYFINNYLYGVVFTITIVGTIIVSVNINKSDKDVIIVQDKPNIVFNSTVDEELLTGTASSYELGIELKRIMKEKDVEAFNNLYIQNYVDEYKGYSINQKKFSTAVEKGLFANDNYKIVDFYYDFDSYEHTIDDVEYLRGNGYTDIMFLVNFYKDDVNLGLFNFSFIVVPYNNRYYLIDYAVTSYDYQIDELNGDVENIDMDLVHCIYGGAAVVDKQKCYEFQKKVYG